MPLVGGGREAGLKFLLLDDGRLFRIVLSPSGSRDGGFEFRIFSGHLRIGAPGAPPASLETLDLKDGSVTLEAVRRGSDAFRRLAEFGPRNKRVLRLDAPDGRSWSFDLVDWSTASGSR